jgi:hypothetical protein
MTHMHKPDTFNMPVLIHSYCMPMIMAYGGLSLSSLPIHTMLN